MDKVKEIEKVFKEKCKNTGAVVVQKNGVRVYEYYQNECTGNSPFHVFSVTKSILSILLVCLIIGIPPWIAWVLYFRHWHLGYGMVLSWDTSRRVIVVRSRLLGSPAYEGGVRVGMTLPHFCGHRISSPQAFEFFKEKCKPKKGVKQTFVFYDGAVQHKANLLPRRIKRKIPVYWDLTKDPQPRLERGTYCSLTGEQHIHKALEEEEMRDCFVV